MASQRAFLGVSALLFATSAASGGEGDRRPACVGRSGRVFQGLLVQVHLADPVAAQVFTYPGAGHLYADATPPDYDADAARHAWPMYSVS